MPAWRAITASPSNVASRLSPPARRPRSSERWCASWAAPPTSWTKQSITCRVPGGNCCGSAEDGYLSACDTRALGLAVVTLGGGRQRPSDSIDHGVGISGFKPLGTKVTKGEPIAFVQANDEPSATRAAETVAQCYRISQTKPAAAPVIGLRIGSSRHQPHWIKRSVRFSAV